MERSEKNVLYYVSFAKGLSIDSEEKLKPSSCAYKDNVYVDNVSGAGLGLFASRSFQVGELVLAEEPFLVLPCKAVTAAEAQSAVAAAVRKLSPALQNIFYSFSDKNTFGHAAQPKTIQGIVDTNGLPMGDQIGGNIPSSAGMYALMCRLNHSCRPNVHHQWNSRLKKQTIHCIRPISPGEELVTAYFNCSGLERSERQKLQKSKWNFNCSCERCLLSEEALVASDTRAREISRLDDGIEMMAGLNPRLGLQYVQQRIDLMKEEDAFDLTELVRTEFDAFQICMNDTKGELFLQARKWIRLSFLHSVQARGLEAEQTRRLRDLCLAPNRIREDLDSEVFKELGSPSFVDKISQRYSFRT